MSDNKLVDFAKIERASDGAQVLVYKITDENDKPAIRYVTDFEGILAQIDIAFDASDEGEAGRDAAFAKADVASADQYRATVAEMVGGQR